MTPDGRHIVFVSQATNLVSGVADGNQSQSDSVRRRDVFVRDMQMGMTRVASVVPDGATTGNSGSYSPALSADGRYVAFETHATNLVAGIADSNQMLDLVIRDLQAGTTELASRRSPLLPSSVTPMHGINSLEDVTPDGRFVVFRSHNSQLDGTSSYTAGGVYVRDRVTGITRLVSRNTTTNSAPDEASGIEIAISADGRYVAFHSSATNLVTGFVDGNNDDDVFLRDLDTGITSIVGYNQHGSATGSEGNSRTYLLTRSGPTVIFESAADDLVNGDRTGSTFNATNYSDIFAYRHEGDGSISGRVSNSVTSSGIPWWTIYIDANGNGRFDAGERNVQTDLNGGYRFTGLPAGSYTLRVNADVGYNGTSPATRTVTLATSTTASTANHFGAEPALVDLLVDQISAPGQVQPGDRISVSWLERNTGSSDISTSWQDAIYLSRDNVLDASDRLLALVPHTGTLAAFSSKLRSASVTMPTLMPGNYWLIVQQDRRFQVTHETNRANNIRATTNPLALTIPTLTLGTPTASQFQAGQSDRYFQFAAAANTSISVLLDSAATNGASEVFVAWNRLPSPSDHDRGATMAGPDQQLVIPAT